MFCFFLVFFAALTVILANPVRDGTNGLSDIIIADNSNEPGDLTFDTTSSNLSLNDGTMKNLIISSSLPGAPIVAPDCILDSYLEEPSDGSIQKRVNVCPATGITQPSQQPTINYPARKRRPSGNRSSDIKKSTEPIDNPCNDIQPHYVTCGGIEFIKPEVPAPNIAIVPNCVPGKSSSHVSLGYSNLTLSIAEATSIPLRSIFPATDEVTDYCCGEFENSVSFSYYFSYYDLKTDHVNFIIRDP